MQDSVKKIVWRWLWWAAVLLALVIIPVVAIKHRPRDYSPPEIAATKQVSPYLTHILLPALYRGAQLGEPFELAITEEGVNDIVCRYGWPLQLGSTILRRPQIRFLPGKIVFMATATGRAADCVVTIEVHPLFNEGKQLNLHIARVLLGAVRVTTLARAMAKRDCAGLLGETDPNSPDLLTPGARSLLYDEAFQPVFEVEGRKVRIARIDVAKGRMSVLVVPVRG